MTIVEAAKQLGHKYTSRAYNLIKQGRLSTEQVDGATHVTEQSVKQYLAARQERKQQRDSRIVRAVPKPSKKSKRAKQA